MRRATAPLACPSLGSRFRDGREWACWLLGSLTLTLPFVVAWADLLAPLALAPWFLALERAPRRVFLRAYVAGALWIGASLGWLLHVGAPAVVLAALVYAPYPAAACWLVSRARHVLGAPIWVAAPLAWVALELGVEHLSLFPATWLFLGHAAWRSPLLVQVAELGGVSLLTALFALTGAATAVALRALSAGGLREVGRRATLLPVLVAAGVFAAAHGVGALRLRGLDLREGPGVGLVQGDIPLRERLDPSRRDEVLLRHGALTSSLGGRELAFVAWPESATGHVLEEDAEALAYVGAAAADMRAPLLLGATGVNEGGAPPSNSAFLVEPGGRISGRADKRILVPGAETLLLLDHIPALRDPLSDWLSANMGFRPYLTPGRGVLTMDVGGFEVGALICYEDGIPAPSAQLLAAGAEALVVLSNESWFGRTELEQHVALAVVRCVETRLPMARATNDGVTCVIDPAGRVTHRLPVGEPGVLAAPLVLAETWRVPEGVRIVVRAAFALGAALLLALSFRGRALARAGS